MGDVAQSSDVTNNTPGRSPSGRFGKFMQTVKSNKKVSIILAVIFVVVVGGLTWLIATQSDDTGKKSANAVAEEYRKKLPELEKAVKDNPNDASARKNYAVALYATGDLKKARDQYEAAVKINNKDATAYNNLGNVYRDLGAVKKAVDSYKKSIDLNKNSINPYVNLANIQLYTQKDHSAAIATYKEGLKNLPGNTQLQLLLGIAYEQANQPDDAKRTYEALLAKDSDNAAAKANLERLNKK